MKVGMYGFMKILVIEVVWKGVMVNIIFLGYIVIDMVMVVDEFVWEKIVKGIFIGCFGGIYEIVYFVFFLVLKDVAFIIGANYVINGG